MCPQERLLALKRSMSFMQDMDFSQQAAILGDEDLAEEAPPPEIIPLPVESAKKSKKQPAKDLKEVIRYANRFSVYAVLKKMSYIKGYISAMLT